MYTKSFNLSYQGFSHIKKNKECQDASCSYYDETMAVAVVCDGHGGNDYVRSAIGSSFACKIAEKNIKNFVSVVDKEELKRHKEQLIVNLEASIISEWNEEVHRHYESNPFTDDEKGILSEKALRNYLEKGKIESAYGTTLIAAVVTCDYWFGIHIGDGKWVEINRDGEFVQPIPWDEKCFLNVTTSICDSDALNNFRFYYSEKLPAAVFVGSDGIDDCFKDDDQLYSLYKTVVYSFATSDFNEAVSDLGEYLPRLSAKGSGDDVSIAAIFDMNLIGGLYFIKNFSQEKNVKNESQDMEEQCCSSLIECEDISDSDAQKNLETKQENNKKEECSEETSDHVVEQSSGAICYESDADMIPEENETV